MVLELEADPRRRPGASRAFRIARSASTHCRRWTYSAVRLMLLGGRCRYKTKISIQYPLVELLSGVLSAVIVWKFGPSWRHWLGLCLHGL